MGHQPRSAEVLIAYSLCTLAPADLQALLGSGISQQSRLITQTERATKDGSILDIPPDHEALPHPGLADGWNPASGPKREGTDNYALWRKGGGLALPVAADTPTGLPTEMRVFKAKK